MKKEVIRRKAVRITKKVDLEMIARLYKTTTEALLKANPHLQNGSKESDVIFVTLGPEEPPQEKEATLDTGVWPKVAVREIHSSTNEENE